MTIPTDIAIATFLTGFAGGAAIWVAVAAVPLPAGGGSGWVGAGVDPLGNSGKNGWSGLGNSGLAGGGGGGGGSEAGGGVVLSGKRGWWRSLLEGLLSWTMKCC